MTPPALGIRELAERAQALGAHDLAQGIIDAAPPDALIRSARSLPLGRLSRYENRRGTLAYRQALRSYLAARGWELSLDQITGTAGATGALASALLADCRPPDTVLLPQPFFIGHKLLLESLGFKIIFLPVLFETAPDWDEVAENMSSARAAIVTTPANPTGHVAPPAVLQRLSEHAAKADCLLLVDEMYREFIWSEEKPDDSAYANLNLANTVIVRSFSKTLAIPGWRAGFAITSYERALRLAACHDALYLGASTIAQHALAAALSKHAQELADYIKNLRALLADNRAILTQAFARAGFHPLPVPAAYYLLLKHNRKSDHAAIEELAEKKIIVTPANILTADPVKDTGYIRIHFAVKPETVQAVSNLLL